MIKNSEIDTFKNLVFVFKETDIMEGKAKF